MALIHLLMPLPRVFLVSAFKLSVRYSPQTTSTLLACCIWGVMYGNTYCLAYSLKVFAVPVGSILVIAAPSKMMTSAAGLAAAAFSCWGARSSKQPTRSDSHRAHVWDCWGTCLVLMHGELTKVSITYLGCSEQIWRTGSSRSSERTPAAVLLTSLWL